MKKQNMLIAGNWKMNLSTSAAEELLKNIYTTLPNSVKDAATPLQNVNGNVAPGFSLLVAPSYLSLQQCQNITAQTSPTICIASQDMHYEKEGAYTGRLSASMLANSGISTSLVGHSETRKYFHETDETIKKKIDALHACGMLAVLCIGETLEERENGDVEKILLQQIEKGAAGTNFEKLIVAYEPVWAIGTGKTATPQQAEEAHAFIKQTLAKQNSKINVPVLYGGSVNETNAGEILAMPSIDGALIGGAALKADSFSKIAQAGLACF